MVSMKLNINGADLQAAVPKLDGTLTVSGIENEIMIWRDGHGIPHVKARTTADAFFGQGFVHAQDRLWQMEFDRRRATGRWSEVVGTSGVLLDTFVRRVGITRSAQLDYEHVDDETRAMVDAYTAGINAFITSTDRLPIEYTITGIEPEPWEAWQSSAVYKVRHIFMGTGLGKLLRARILNAQGPELASKFRSEGLGDEILIVPPGEQYASALVDLCQLDPGQEAITRLSEFDSGSNNWALDGSRTASGKPLVAGDPHRALDVPNVYYQNHVACPEFDVVGYSFCGVPGFPHFGHNESVAWCITHAAADYQDLYVEHFNPDNSNQYEYMNAWLETERHTETIEVRDADPVEIDVSVTRNGPVVIGSPDDEYAISFRYSALVEPVTGFRSLHTMLTTSSVDEFETSMRDWVDPCNNLITADVHGNISYLTRGKVPIRSMANAWLPVPGWSGEHDWQGYIPFEEMPRSRNPETGWLVTANNRIVGRDYPHYLALDFAPPSRAQRIITRIEEIGDQAVVDDMQSIHGDRLSLVSPIYIRCLENSESSDPRTSEALDRLRAWDGVMDKSSVAAAIYIVMRDQICRIVAESPALSPIITNPFAASEPPGVGPGFYLWFMLTDFVRRDDTSILATGESWQSIAEQALGRAVSWLSSNYGDDIDGWRWEVIHRTNPIHTLALAEPSLGELLNPPRIALGGDADTPQASGINPLLNYNVAGTSVTRYIFDLDDWSKSRWIVPFGCSGHPGSPHHEDQMERWSDVDSIPMLYDWQQIEQQATAVQRLLP